MATDGPERLLGAVSQLTARLSSRQTTVARRSPHHRRARGPYPRRPRNPRPRSPGETDAVIGECGPVVGEIAAGVLLGRTGLGRIDTGNPTTAFLPEVGFAMLMFAVGTRLPLRDPGLRDSVRPSALAALLTLAFAVPAGFGLALAGPDRPLVLPWSSRPRRRRSRYRSCRASTARTAPPPPATSRPSCSSRSAGRPSVPSAPARRRHRRRRMRRRGPRA
jgi:hypothetical protein